MFNIGRDFKNSIIIEWKTLIEIVISEFLKIIGIIRRLEYVGFDSRKFQIIPNIRKKIKISEIKIIKK